MVLVCAATELELSCFPETEGAAKAVTGVGVPATLALLPPLLEKYRPALAINIGIAGAYTGVGLEIGDVVLGEREVFGDLGFELPGGGFAPLQDSPFGAWYEPLALHVPLGIPPQPSLRRISEFLGAKGGSQRAGLSPPLVAAQRHCNVAARPKSEKDREGAGGSASRKPGEGAGGWVPGVGVTVNACTGTLATGERRRDRFGASFETMEGAAFALACQSAGVPAVEVRAISNFASERDMRPENIQKALAGLAEFLLRNRDALLRVD